VGTNVAVGANVGDTLEGDHDEDKELLRVVGTGDDTREEGSKS